MGAVVSGGLLVNLIRKWGHISQINMITKDAIATTPHNRPLVDSEILTHLRGEYLFLTPGPSIIVQVSQQ